MNRRQKIEAIAEAIICYSGYHNPDSGLYLARNPGALKAFSPEHPRDENGIRVFNSVLDGMQALIFDVELKVTGKSIAHLEPSNTILHLALAYNQPITASKAWLKFIRRALRDQSINATTPLSYFTDTKE